MCDEGTYHQLSSGTAQSHGARRKRWARNVSTPAWKGGDVVKRLLGSVRVDSTVCRLLVWEARSRWVRCVILPAACTPMGIRSRRACVWAMGHTRLRTVQGCGSYKAADRTRLRTGAFFCWIVVQASCLRCYAVSPWGTGACGAGDLIVGSLR